MLAAILLGLFMLFSGSGNVLGTMMTRHVTDEVKKNIPDEERRKLALKGLAVVNDDIKKLNDQLSKDLGQMEKLIKDYDSKPEDFDRLFSSVLAKRQELVDRIWDDRTMMLRHVRAEEWQAIMAGAQAAMEKDALKK
jgi:adenylosuccinate synthase